MIHPYYKMEQKLSTTPTFVFRVYLPDTTIAQFRVSKIVVSKLLLITGRMRLKYQNFLNMNRNKFFFESFPESESGGNFAVESVQKIIFFLAMLFYSLE